jgi:hypothetical protein
MDHWPVVLDMGLCMAYWIRNLLAGRPIEHTRVSQGAKRPRGVEDEPERTARQRTAGSTHVGNAAPRGPSEGYSSSRSRHARGSPYWSRPCHVAPPDVITVLQVFMLLCQE